MRRFNRAALAAIAGLLLCGPLPSVAQDAHQAVAGAFARAEKQRSPVLVDFQAPWCYSCYYMATHVLAGPDWDRVRGETVVLDLDADSPEGAHWMKQWNVKVLPTYVLFSGDGRELGRLPGEQTRADFYGWLNTTAGRADTLEGLKARVTDDGPASLAAAREVLKTFHARFDSAGGLGWYLTLPPRVRAAVGRDAASALWVGRLELQRAATDKDVRGCAKAGAAVMAANLGCERPYEVDKVVGCTETLDVADRRELLRPQAELLQLLFEKRVRAEGLRCPDERSVVLTGADLHQLLGESQAESALLDRAIMDLRTRLGTDLARDRNLADNLRVYLERASRFDELDELLLQLIKAYPDDYVYAYRYAKTVASRGKHEEALPYYERAAAKAYGANRLRNAELHAKSLKMLGRPDDAQRVVDEALRVNGPWFPEDVARLKAVTAATPPATQ